MRKKKFQKFQNCLSFEFFSEFFWQTLNFFFQVLPWSDFFQTLYTYSKKYLLSYEQRKKIPFFPKGQKIDLEKGRFFKVNFRSNGRSYQKTNATFASKGKLVP